MEKRYGKIKSVTVKVQRGLGAKPPEAKRYMGFRILKNVPVYTVHAEIIFLF